MFKNVGGTLKTFAKILNVVAWVELAAGVIIELATGFEFVGAFIGGGLVAAGGAFIMAVCLYAFGQITDDVHRMSTGDEGEKPMDDEIPEI